MRYLTSVESKAVPLQDESLVTQPMPDPAKTEAPKFSFELTEKYCRFVDQALEGG